MYTYMPKQDTKGSETVLSPTPLENPHSSSKLASHDEVELQKTLDRRVIKQFMRGQKQALDNFNQAQYPIQRKANNTGLPDQLKSGLEHLSGIDLSDVKVHYNSDKPKNLQALAYAQGNDIYLGPGQEKHLPHEAWHVVQQKQGRVKPTMQFKGVEINDSIELEKEADIMSQRANNFSDEDSKQNLKSYFMSTQKKTIQCVRKNILNLISRNRGGFVTNITKGHPTNISTKKFSTNIPTRKFTTSIFTGRFPYSTIRANKMNFKPILISTHKRSYSFKSQNKDSFSNQTESQFIENGIEKRTGNGTGKTGEGIPLDKVERHVPHVLDYIYPNDNGAFGYLPRKGTAYDKPEYDFTNVEFAKEMQKIRKEYLEATKNLENDIEKMTAEGYSKEEIAKYVVKARNQQKMNARKNMPKELLAGLEERNKKKYNDPLGPTADVMFINLKKSYLKEGIDKSDEQIWEIIIQKSMKKDDVINTLLGLEY